MSDPITWSSERRALTELHPAPYNPREMTEAQVHDLAASLQRFNLADPLVINANNTVIGGHQRLVLLQQQGVSEVDVRVPSRLLTEEEERELNLRLNKNLGQWDFDALANFDATMLQDVGFTSPELDRIFQLESPEADDVPECSALPDVSPGDLFQLGVHRLLCGDATKRVDMERLLRGEQVDIVITDPPYGVSYADKNAYLNTIARGNSIQTPITNDHQTEENICTLWLQSFELIRDVLAPVNAYYIFGPQIQGMMMMMMMKAKLPYRHVIIWVKDNHVLGRCDYHYRHEPIFFGWTTKHKFHRAGEFLTSVWEVAKPRKSELHPTMKPIKVLANALMNSSDRGDRCLDVFGGSGSTLIACEQVHRQCRMMEIDPQYCRVIINRWEQFTGQRAERLETIGATT